jgi:hypothetical protein
MSRNGTGDTHTGSSSKERAVKVNQGNIRSIGSTLVPIDRIKLPYIQ